MLSTSITATWSPHLSHKNLGTGNVLFQISSIYGLSRRYSMTPEFTSVHTYCKRLDDLFGYTHGNTLYRNCVSIPTTYTVHLQETQFCEKSYDSALMDNVAKHAHENILAEGYLEYPPYFHSYRDDILAMFSPDTESQRYIDDTYPELRLENTVALHIRSGLDANVRCTMEYYKRAISFINKRVENPLYLIFSDGRVDISELGIRAKHVSGNPDYIDIWTMSQCAHVISTYSTFSWWGAYLNKNPNKIVTYPMSALRYIQTRCTSSAETLHTDYFLHAVPIEDVY